MSYTNSTSNLRLPQWLASDKPNWDIDLNDTFRKIDDFAGEKNTGDAAMSARINENKDSITALQGEVNSVEGEVTTLTGRVGDLEQENDSQQSAIDKLNNDYTALDDTVAGQGTRLTTAEGDIDSLEAQTAINTGNIAALQSAVNNDWQIGEITFTLSDPPTKPTTQTVPLSISPFDEELPSKVIVLDARMRTTSTAANEGIVNYENKIILERLLKGETGMIFTAAGNLFTVYQGGNDNTVSAISTSVVPFGNINGALTKGENGWYFTINRNPSSPVYFYAVRFLYKM